MASKVPKFGAWEGGENYTVYFDNARKTKQNGAMINPNDPEDNPGMSLKDGVPAQAPPTHSRNGSQGGQQAKVPQFGAWDSGENVGYTSYFENARKTKNSGPTNNDSEPQMNRDMHPRKAAPAQTQTRPATIKPEPHEARSKVPQFGAWEGAGEVAYTACFDNVRRNKNGPIAIEQPSKAPQPNRDVSPSNEPSAKEARSKVPQFGAWEGGEGVAYTAYFDNARKNRDEMVEPQLNRDVGDRARPPSAAPKVRSEEYLGQGGRRGSKEQDEYRNANRGSTGSETSSRPGRQTPGGQSPLNPRGGKPQSKSGSRGSQNPEKAASIPAFGVWNKDPAVAEGFTGAFQRAREDRMTPPSKNNSSSYNQQTHNQEAKKGCCFPWFG